MTPERIRAIAERCAEDMGDPDDFIISEAATFIAAAIETALEEAGRPGGVDLRDRFAMAALAGSIRLRTDFADAATDCYRIADAMLAARKP